MDEATIRPAAQHDIPAMVGLLAQLFAIEADFAIDPAVQARGLAMLLGRDHSVALVATVGARVVGMMTVQLTVSTARGGLSAGIEDVVVDAAHRGRGLGRRLLAAAEAWARGRGAVRLALLADETNAPALDFYDHLGFTRTRLTWLAKPLG
jgi:ribosomal protein S18 acetylase RimI-like enzyme